jgi:hypothetical protein
MTAPNVCNSLQMCEKTRFSDYLPRRLVMIFTDPVEKGSADAAQRRLESCGVLLNYDPELAHNGKKDEHAVHLPILRLCRAAGVWSTGRDGLPRVLIRRR